MFLRAIATYDYLDGEPPVLIERKSAHKGYSRKILTDFEKKHLPDFLQEKKFTVLPQTGRFLYAVSSGNYYYFERDCSDARDRLLVLQSKSEITPMELKYLFVNMNHIDADRKAVRDTLEDMLANPPAYTGHDILIKSVRRGVEQTKEVLLDDVGKLLDRGEKLEVLVSQTAALERSSQAFLENSRQLKEQQQCCSGTRTFFRHTGEAISGAATSAVNPFASNPVTDEVEAYESPRLE